MGSLRVTLSRHLPVLLMTLVFGASAAVLVFFGVFISYPPSYPIATALSETEKEAIALAWSAVVGAGYAFMIAKERRLTQAKG